MTLKPCPFCGGGEIRPSLYNNWSLCVGCGATGPRDEAAWNTRTTVEETPEEYRARIVEEACEALAICASNEGMHIGVEGVADVRRLVSAAYGHSIFELTESAAAEAEALLRTGWRPDWWGAE